MVVVVAAACTPPSPPTAEVDERPAARASAAAQATTAATATEPDTEPDTDPDCVQPCRRAPRVVGRFDVAAAPEASGLAASRRNRGVLYVLDDGPQTTSLLAVRVRGGDILGRLAVQGLDGTDTESLAVGRCGAATNASCIYIGDIGDNTSSRESITVTRVREPALRAGGGSVPVQGDSVTWRYPDGPRDAEALLVAPDGMAAIVTKDPGRRGLGAARLYVTRTFADTTLRAAGRVRLPRPASPGASAVVGHVVTGGDAAGGRVVLRTYDAIYEFTAPTPTAAVDTFPTWPVREVTSPAEAQGEAIAYARDGCGLFTVSEGSGALTSIPCR